MVILTGRITNTEVTKVLEENDYTEGWDTPTDNDDNDNDEQYAYDYDDDNDQRSNLLDIFFCEFKKFFKIF